MRMTVHRGFTLVEILIVVVILGILVAIVVPQYANATQDAQQRATYDQLLKIRRAVDVYYVRNSNRYPTVIEGSGTWGEIVLPGSVYLRETPKNQWAGGVNATRIVLGTAPDVGFTTEYGWIFDPGTGQVWAASFSEADQPLPRP